jgi:beta-glucosidase
LGTQFIKGLQGDNPYYLKVVATPKHFAANNEEHNRFVCNPQITERQLREYYFPAFEMCIREGKSASIMSAYNAINNVPCMANAWYPGEQGGTTVAEVLFGDYNPGGRLPVTYYNRLDELPAFDDYDITKGRTYQYFTGKTLYPFGYGLSYTTFEYKNLKLADTGNRVQVSFEVKDTGSVTGDEVSQVYVKLPDTGIVMPVKELKGFQRTTIRKGETKKVEIAIRKDLLRYWDENTEKFVVPDGTYEFMVGSSSAYIKIREQLILR